MKDFFKMTGATVVGLFVFSIVADAVGYDGGIRGYGEREEEQCSRSKA